MKKTINQFLHKYDLGSLNEWLDVLSSAIEIILIILIAILISKIFTRLSYNIERRISNSAKSEDKKRVHTLARVSRYIATILIVGATAVLCLAELGISIAPLLATAGVAGIAIGFGAQSLVKDYFTGFVMLIENQIRQDDIVEIAGKVGTVEEVTLRYVRLRDYDGAVHFIPNSSITLVTNRTRTFAYAVTDIGVSFKADLSKVYQVMRSTVATMRTSNTFAEIILDDLEIAGVETIGESAIVIRSRLMVKAQHQGMMRRQLLENFKKALEEHQIEIPYPHLVIEKS